MPAEVPEKLMSDPGAAELPLAGSTQAMKLAAEAAARGTELPKTPAVGPKRPVDPKVEAELEKQGRALLFLNPGVDAESLSGYGMQIVGQLQLLTIQSQRLMTLMRQRAQESMLGAVKANDEAGRGRGGQAAGTDGGEGGDAQGGGGRHEHENGDNGNGIGSPSDMPSHAEVLRRIGEMWDEIHLAMAADMQWREAAMSFVQNMVMQIMKSSDTEQLKRPGLREKELVALNAALSHNMLERAAELELYEMSHRGRLFGEDWGVEPEAGVPDPEPGYEPLPPPLGEAEEGPLAIDGWREVSTSFFAALITQVPVLRLYSSCLQLACSSPHVSQEQYLEIVVHMLASRGGPPPAPFASALAELDNTGAENAAAADASAIDAAKEGVKT